MFQYEEEANEAYETLVKRLEKYCLEVEQEETRILLFGRYKLNNETFVFLDFTNYNGKACTGTILLTTRRLKK